MSNPFDRFSEPDAGFPGVPIPQEILNLSENINDIMLSISAVRGKEYAAHLANVFVLIQQSSELENIACESLAIIHSHTDPDSTDPDESVEDKAFSDEMNAQCHIRHQATHMLGEGLKTGLEFILRTYELSPEFKGITRDVEILCERVKIDWKDKIPKHT